MFECMVTAPYSSNFAPSLFQIKKDTFLVDGKLCLKPEASIADQEVVKLYLFDASSENNLNKPAVVHKALLT